jgi:hypothetical protein
MVVIIAIRIITIARLIRVRLPVSGVTSIKG